MTPEAQSLQTTLTVAGDEFHVDVSRRVRRPPEAPRLVAVSRVTNERAFGILQTMVAAIRRFTPEDHDLWIVDNCSPEPWGERIKALERVNVVLNKTEPIPPEARGAASAAQEQHGSYANGIGLELGAAVVEQDIRYFMCLHMDTMPCRRGWLSLVRGRIDAGASAAGVELHRGRTPEGVLHPQGLMVDFQRFRSLGLDFLPRLPQYDVGDRVTVRLREAGDAVYAFRNTLWQPELVECIPHDSPCRAIVADRALDDDGNVFFLHLGRGVTKAAGRYWKKDRMTAEEWTRLAARLLAADDGVQ